MPALVNEGDTRMLNVSPLLTRGLVQLEKRLHHQKAVFAIVVIFADALDYGVTGSAIEILRRSIADADLEHNRRDLALTKRSFNVREQALGNFASPVFRGNADGREMCGVVFVDHHKRKTNHFRRRRHHAIAQCSRLVQQIFKRVLCVVVALTKTSDIEP